MFSEKGLNTKPKQTPANDKIYYTETLKNGKKLVVGWIIDTIWSELIFMITVCLR